MQTKFIEDTNNQYSIGEDGNVIQHYKLTWAGNITKLGIDKIMPKYGNNKTYINICTNGKNNGLSINTLLMKYYSFKYCVGCNNKLFDDKRIKCDQCIKKYNDEYNYNTKKFITKGYVADKLNISINDLDQDLYELYKVKLMCKRKLSQITNKSISCFK